MTVQTHLQLFIHPHILSNICKGKDSNVFVVVITRQTHTHTCLVYFTQFFNMTESISTQFLVCMLLKFAKPQLTQTNDTLEALDFPADAERVSKHCVACHALENTAVPIVYHTDFSVLHRS